MIYVMMKNLVLEIQVQLVSQGLTLPLIVWMMVPSATFVPTKIRPLIIFQGHYYGTTKSVIIPLLLVQKKCRRIVMKRQVTTKYI